LTGHIARQARRLAPTRPGGRLDPPLALWLDEAALISPVPLHSWTSDMGGRGVTIGAAFQSRAQLLARWGEHQAATILNNSGVMVFGGTRDRDDLQFWSTLAGERDEPITTTDLHGRVASRSTRRVPVLAAAQIANLPFRRVLVIRKGMPPVVGRAQMVWERRDIRTHHRAARRATARQRRALAIQQVQAWRDRQLEHLLTALARRWPARFAEAAQRVRDANAMFAELRRIQDQAQQQEQGKAGDEPESRPASTRGGAE
jgi:type IV secretion system protein VirD4